MAGEKKLERKLVREVKKMGGIALKFFSSFESGWTDRIVIMPKTMVYWVETKSPGEPLDPLQKVVKKRLEKLDHLHFKIDNDSDLERFLKLIKP